MSFLHILGLMMPVLIPVALGQLFTRAGIFAPEHGKALLKYLLYATFPALILDHLAGQPFATLFQPAFTLATLVFVTVLYVLVFLLYRFGFGRSQGDAAMAALTGSFVSAGIVGLPVMLDIIGPTYTVIPVIVNTILSLVTAVPITILLVQLDKRRSSANLGATLRRTLLDVLKNPLVFSGLLGLLVSWLALPIPGWLHESMEKIGAATFATSLFAVGMGIDLSLLRDNLRDLLVLSGLRIFLSSAVGFLLAMGFGLEPGYALSFVIMASLPTAKSVPPIAQEYGVFAGEAVQVVTVTTLSMVIVLPIVCYLGDLIWPGIIR